MTVSIFVSHRHADEPIAEAISAHLKQWLNGRGEVFRSSKPGSGRPGNDLDNVLQSQIKQTDVFVLVFTLADEDWSWCMYELGIAKGQDTKDTTVVVFNCTDERPKVRVANLEVNAREAASIMNFVMPFHTEPEWLIPDKKSRDSASELCTGLAFLGEDTYLTRADELQLALAGVLPKSKAASIERLEHFSLALEPNDVKTVRDLRTRARTMENTNPQEYDKLRKEAHLQLRNKAVITTPHNAAAASRFGYSAFDDGTKLGDLLDTWQLDFSRNYEKNPEDKERGWIVDFLSDLSRATEGRRSTPSDYYMKSVDTDDQSRVQPVVARVETTKDDRLVFTIYLFRVRKTTVFSGDQPV